MKLNKYIFISVTALMFCITDLSAQNILTSTIEWNSNSTFTASTGNSSDEVTKVVSSPSQIIWYDNAGVAQHTLEIVGSEGSWTNISNNGSILLKVKEGDFFGIAQFIKSGSSRTVRIQLVLENESPIYELTIIDTNAL